MRGSFYSKLAVDGIKKNKKLYFPYLLTCILMVVAYYIISNLATSPTILQMRGGGNLQLILGLGRVVMAVFSVLLLIYTNSFLIKKRNKEFGLYNILGMNKKNVGKVLVFEGLYTYLGSMIVGLFIGVVFSKLAELVLTNLVLESANYAFNINTSALIGTIVFFAGIFLVILLNGLRLVHFSNPIELLKSEAMGEKPVKANYFLGFAGLAILVAAYYIAVTIDQPLAAFVKFFIAVIMVIIATYLLFVTGSVLLCKMLAKNKNFYYKKKNFVAVSQMTYRMKRNGAGLASICILLTMVLVIISSTAALYFGAEDTISTHYPLDITTFACGYGRFDESLEGRIKEIIDRNTIEYNAQPTDDFYTFSEGLLAVYKNGVVDLDSEETANNLDNILRIEFMSIDNYNESVDEPIVLADNHDVLLFTDSKIKIPDDWQIGEETFHIVKRLSGNGVEVGAIPSTAIASTSICDYAILLVSDMSVVEDAYADNEGRYSSILQWSINQGYNTDLSLEDQINLSNAIRAELLAIEESGECNMTNTYCTSRTANREDFYSTFGGLFFIGIMLSIVFLIAAVLIIYYKQISEGFEDQGRFTIMKKVGMTGKDIRATINSQMLMVFLLPIMMAAIHMCFAFPIVNKLLMLFGLFNTSLEFAITGGVIVLMAIFYTIIYKITSNGYFAIVNGSKA